MECIAGGGDETLGDLVSDGEGVGEMGALLRETLRSKTDGWKDDPNNLDPEKKEAKESGASTLEIYMNNPPEKTSGLPADMWREVEKQLADSENWNPERRELQDLALTLSFMSAWELSTRVREYEIAEGRKPTIYCLRGTCGAGKTTALHEGIFGGILDENGEPSGALAPDVLKTLLRERGDLTHAQVHDESGMLSRKLAKKLQEVARKMPFSLVYDKLMAYSTDFEDVFKDAKETDREVAILDMDIPLELSAVRVLSRDAGGEDPLVTFDGVATAFSSIRKNRSALFEQISQNSGLMSIYTLRVFDPETKQSVEAVKLEDGKLKAIPGREELAKTAVLSSDEKIDEQVKATRDTVITEEYIDYFVKTYFNEDSKKYAEKSVATLREHLGETLGEALDNKAK